MGHTSNLDAFLNLHREQLVSSGIPEHYWNYLYGKIQDQAFNAGDTFELLQVDYEGQRKPDDPAWVLRTIRPIEKTDPIHIYLIDHAWTFRVGHAKNQLLLFDSLRKRLQNMLGLGHNPSKDKQAEEVFDNVWKLCNTYSIGNADNIEDRLPVWYVMDEIGSAVTHSDNPNCRIVPVVCATTQITYSLLFPIKNIEINTLMSRDFAEGVTDPDQRAAALLPWIPQAFTHSFKPPIPGPDYYLSGHIRETLPDLKNFTNHEIKPVYKVFTEYDLVSNCLKLDQFEVVGIESEADILWYTRHFKDFAGLSETPEKFVNQFPFEYVLTVKDLLSLTCRKSATDDSVESPKWLPVTYNLKTEIGNFVSYFQHRENEGLDNHWIIKPFNLARSLDTHITNNLNYIMRLPASGPKIAQKYINDPVLFYRPECEGSVKFDIRYVILLQSVRPLKAAVYKEFFLRFANKPFELRDFHIFEKHFTVMNYEENVDLKHMLCAEFKELWGKQYANLSWDTVETSILNMLREILQCAVKDEPPCGIAHSPQSRALYAADLMLEWTADREVQPKILEINWTPDCQRACDYYPSFYNDIFKLLFLNEKSDSIIELF